MVLNPVMVNPAFGPHPRMPTITVGKLLSDLTESDAGLGSVSDEIGRGSPDIVLPSIISAIRSGNPNAEGRALREKVIRQNNLMSIAWLARGLELKRCVCRVNVGSGMGTGFLVNGDFLLTNNHVISSKAEAEEASLEFNYELGWDATPQPVSTYRLDTSRFKTNAELDYTIVRVTGSPSRTFGAVDLRARARVKPEDYVTIIQHPNGGHKKIALTDNQVFLTFSHLVQYVTDTEPGSSGSPVFDQGWKLVALHHAGGHMPGPDGKTAYVNEGIAIEEIVRDAAEIVGLTDEIFEAVTGRIRPTLEWLCGTAGSRADIHAGLAMVTIHGGDFTEVLKNRVGGNAEIAPFGAALIGLASGALIRHIGKQNETSIHASFPIEDAAKAAALKAVDTVRGSSAWPWAVYSEVLERARGDQGSLASLVQHAESLEALPVVVGALLAGAVVGAKAYDGKL